MLNNRLTLKPDWMKVIIETKQLVLREFSAADGEFILGLLNSPGWLKFIGNRDIETVEEAQLYLLTGPVSSYEKQGFGLYLVIRKADGAPLGMCGLIRREGLNHVDLGFAFMPEYMGKGYAFEAALATMKFASETLGMNQLDAITMPENSRAIALLEKLGFRYRQKITLPNEDTPLMLFHKHLLQPAF